MEKWLIDSGNAVVEDWTRNEPQDMSQVKHVIEHRIATPRQYHLPPLANAPQPPPPSVPQHIIQQVPVPQPIYQNLVPEQPKQMFNKADFMDMMMIQQQQVSQLVMQQLMLAQLGRYRNDYPYYPVSAYAEPAEPVWVARPGGAVHHHHYSMTPAPMAAPVQQPVVHHYQSLPPLEGRMLSPARARQGSAPYYTSGNSGSQYFVYH